MDQLNEPQKPQKVNDSSQENARQPTHTPSSWQKHLRPNSDKDILKRMQFDPGFYNEFPELNVSAELREHVEEYLRLQSHKRLGPVHQEKLNGQRELIFAELANIDQTYWNAENVTISHAKRDVQIEAKTREGQILLGSLERFVNRYAQELDLPYTVKLLQAPAKGQTPSF